MTWELMGGPLKHSQRFDPRGSPVFPSHTAQWILDNVPYVSGIAMHSAVYSSFRSHSAVPQRKYPSVHSRRSTLSLLIGTRSGGWRKVRAAPHIGACATSSFVSRDTKIGAQVHVKTAWTWALEQQVARGMACGVCESVSELDRTRLWSRAAPRPSRLRGLSVDRRGSVHLSVPSHPSPTCAQAHFC